MKNLLHHIVLFTLILFLCNKINAQQFGIKNFGVAEGLGQSQVQAIAQDSLGFLWIGTLGGGVSRFDGSQFSNYSRNKGLKSNFVLSIQVIDYNTILVGTTSGLCKISKDSIYHSFTNSALDTLIIQDIQLPYIATSSGLFLYDMKKAKRFEKIATKCGRGILQLAIANDKIWGATNHGIIEYEGDEIKCRTDLNSAHNHHFTSVINDYKGGVWAGSLGGGLTNIKNDGSFINYSRNAGLETYNISCLYKDSKGNIWIGSKGQGVSKFKDGKFTKITTLNGLANDFVNTIYEDKTGNIWFGTSNGISKYHGEKYVLFDKTSFLPGGGAHTLLQDQNGGYWFASFAGGVFYKKEDNATYYNRSRGFTNKRVRVIFEDQNGKMWFGTDGNGLYSFHSGRFKKAALGNVWVSDIKQRDSTYFVATLGNGLYTIQQDSIKNYLIQSSYSRNRINRLVQDTVVWMATDNGAFYYKNDSIYFESKIPKERFTTLTKSKDGILYFGNIGKGIFTYNGVKSTNLNNGSGLLSDNVYTVHHFGKTLWVGTERGINEIETNKDGSFIKIKKHTAKKGFLGIENIRNGIYVDLNQYFWFATVNGLVRYIPKADMNHIPAVFIQSIELFYEPISENSILGRSSSLKNNVFSFTKNHFTFRFQGIDFNTNGPIQYSWRVLGLDEIWSTPTSQNFATYPKLAPGEYVFQVKAIGQNSDSKILQQPFTIEQPYWEKSWFKYSVILLCIIFIGLITWFIIKGINKKNRAKTEKLKVERKMIELEQQALRLQMNPHFLFNSLNAIKGAIAQQDTKAAKTSLDQFAKLMRALLENTQEGYIPLYKDLNLIKQYLGLEQLNHDFEYEVQIGDNISENILIPGMIIQPLIENAVLHGVSPMKTKGKIDVRFEKLSDNIILCEIEDNGIGRKASQKAKDQSVHKQTSRALSNIIARLDILKQSGKDAGLEIIDKTSDSGTIVKLKLPIK